MIRRTPKRKKCYMDADGSLYRDYAIFPIMDIFEQEKLIDKGESERLHEYLENLQGDPTGFSEFVHGTLNTAAMMLKGRKLAVAERIAELYFADPNYPWYGYVKPAMEEMKEAGVESVLITAAPNFIARGIVSALGMNDSRSGRFGVRRDGTFNGKARILESPDKAAAVIKLNRSASHTYAFGDSPGDIGMLSLVDEPVCVDPMQELRKFAVQENWVVLEDPDKPLVEVHFAA